MCCVYKNIKCQLQNSSVIYSFPLKLCDFTPHIVFSIKCFVQFLILRCMIPYDFERLANATAARGCGIWSVSASGFRAWNLDRKSPPIFSSKNVGPFLMCGTKTRCNEDSILMRCWRNYFACNLSNQAY